MFSVNFPDAISDYDILMDTVIDANGVTLPDACIDEMDMIGVGRILDAVPHGSHSDFNLFGVSVIETDDVTLYDACINEMDMIGTSRILDAAPHGPRSALDMFGAFMLEIDDDDLLLLLLLMLLLLRECLILWTHLFLLTLCSVVEYPEWLANVVPVPKKEGKVRVCVDFRDLNKASPKDDFPLPHIDMLVDRIQAFDVIIYGWVFLGHAIWVDECKATYQRATTTLFHDMMHRDVEIRAILDMPALRTKREIRGFFGKLQYISRFMARLTDICEPIFRLLRKSQPTVWDDDCQRAFEKIKECLLSSPV
ncbi:hypothetical protein CK203_107915 [Vitis vinifera]|uniref:Transposon Ty3-I Gag-Pol polyprotein n=1 Tax=Vitis vinifera TaxID=29760 RepID=A0A438DCV6_VITVI|nr:hypothetical protein CK203_107915 [Vitis vinifera]